MKHPPAFVARKLQDLESHAADLNSWAATPMQRAEQARRQLGDFHMRLQSARSLQGSVDPLSGSGKPTPETVRTEIERLGAEIEAGVTEAELRRKLAADSQQILLRCREWVSTLPDTLHLVPALQPKIANGDAAKMLAVVRADIGEKRAKLSELKAAPLSSEEVTSAALARVKLLATAGGLGFHPSRSPGQPSAATVLALLCKLWPEQIAAEFSDQYFRDFKAIMPGAEPIAASDRTQRLARIEAELLAAERSEEAIIERLHHDGAMRVVRRIDGSPQAVLACVVEVSMAEAESLIEAQPAAA